jgi:tRNA (mo5U34)-methyltransferase
MTTRIEANCFRLDRSLTADELTRYSRLIAELAPRGYLQGIRIEDASGKSLKTLGLGDSFSALALWDSYGFPADFSGKTVLDVGCNSGFFSLVAKLRGARQVMGVDRRMDRIDQARLIREITGIDVDFQVGDGQDLDEGVGPFDFTINTGVMYHLQDPMRFLARVGRITREAMFVESELLTDPRCAEHAWFIDKAYAGDPSNWWIFGPECLGRMLRTAGFRRVDFRGFTYIPPAGTTTPEGLERQGRGVFNCYKH